MEAADRSTTGETPKMTNTSAMVKTGCPGNWPYLSSLPCQWGPMQRTGLRKKSLEPWGRTVTGESFRRSEGYFRRDDLGKPVSLSGTSFPYLCARTAVQIQPGPEPWHEAGTQYLRSSLSVPVLSIQHPPSPTSLLTVLLAFSCWVAAFFSLLCVFYFISCCQSKPLLKSVQPGRLSACVLGRPGLGGLAPPTHLSAHPSTGLP